ncbi:hypothetical protein [Photobacterium sp. TY1-4]|uniref:hypothetical protein n=1 Tax=Photobacterium sp. TY1-4 TaxID=2899122 RepID=UPI0021C0A287|nr:hypothetical protein [Photobacterium sp. TY1-4]UXI02985.1 hypothetical protein NH461_21295 [Photobacterium sp. TY1-4]
MQIEPELSTGAEGLQPYTDPKIVRYSDYQQLLGIIKFSGIRYKANGNEPRGRQRRLVKRGGKREQDEMQINFNNGPETATGKIRREWEYPYSFIPYHVPGLE